MKLVLLRHGESEYNRDNLFTGWTDCDLSDLGKSEAVEAGKLLKAEGYDFDVCYTSLLKRAIHTLNSVLEQMDRDWLPVVKTWRLNERHYGALQGLNKAQTAAKYGDEQVKIWRRSYDIQPPALTEDDARNPRISIQYANVEKSLLPLTESLKDTVDRVIPLFNDFIKKDMLAGKRVLIAAHGNSIRALVKYLENISEKDILNLNIPTGVPVVYEFDDNVKFLKRYFLGDQEAIAARINKVVNQGKAK